MSATQFKLTKPGGLTRRITFAERPSWFALATKIEALYAIPIEKIAVSYIDKDGDSVTLSSHEELQDFYTHSYQNGDAVKFTVVDLGSMRAAMANAIPSVDESTTGPVNAGPEVLFGVDEEDWQTLPQFPAMFVAPDVSDGPHAFVEVIESDARSTVTGKTSSVSDTPETPTPTAGQKGKNRAWGNDQGSVSSAGTILSSETPSKHPVHVFDMSDRGARTASQSVTSPITSRGMDFNHPSIGEPPKVSPIGSAFGWSHTSHSPPPVVRVDSGSSAISYNSSEDAVNEGKPLPKTPSTRPASFTPHDESSQHTPKATNATIHPDKSPAEVDDPPLEVTGSENTSPVSLAGDVANLLDALGRAFSTHPELSEGVRNIIRNAAGGLYWATERERIVGVAEEIRRAAQESGEAISLAAQETGAAVSQAAKDASQTAEEEAGRRVAAALGGIFKVVGDIVNSVNGVSSESPSQAPQSTSPPNVNDSVHPAPPSNDDDMQRFPPLPMFAPPPPVFGPPIPPPPPPILGPSRSSPYPGPPPPGHFSRFPFGPHPGPMLHHTLAPWTSPRGPHGPFHTPHGPRHGPHHGPRHGPPGPPHGPHDGPPMPPPPPSPGNPVPPPPPGADEDGTHQRRAMPWWMDQLVSGNTTSQPRRHNTWSGGARFRQNRDVDGPGNESFGSFGPSAYGQAPPDDTADPHERKAQLEAAKAYYKAEKERFRQLKDERRKARREADERRAEEGLGPNLSQDGETIVARIPLVTHRESSMRRGPSNRSGHAKIPSFAEVYAVSPSRSREPKVEDVTGSNTIANAGVIDAKFEDRVIARLGDMGFTAAKHPNIPTLVEQYTIQSGSGRKESEDTIVAKILEVLISQGSNSPGPSGTNTRV
ncbi:hypothetical protein BD410DRAFT_782096 [Rickenella mellea]|uniref:PB1 domain-containing protein n=1 Tax=Rickenella mellea TaxID=50990 RepID=A0A4Y7QLM7_9AGAM|nr:hypothetical protein BD410DRAFT_782096 [Rickenella mellea]